MAAGQEAAREMRRCGEAGGGPVRGRSPCQSLPSVLLPQQQPMPGITAVWPQSQASGKVGGQQGGAGGQDWRGGADSHPVLSLPALSPDLFLWDLTTQNLLRLGLALLVLLALVLLLAEDRRSRKRARARAHRAAARARRGHRRTQSPCGGGLSARGGIEGHA